MTLVPITLELNATADIPTGNMGYVDFDETAPYVNISGGGIIDITDFQTYFGSTVTTLVPQLTLSVQIGGTWYDGSQPHDGITYAGGLVDTMHWTLNYPTGTIQALKGRIS